MTNMTNAVNNLAEHHEYIRRRPHNMTGVKSIAATRTGRETVRFEDSTTLYLLGSQPPKTANDSRSVPE